MVFTRQDGKRRTVRQACDPHCIESVSSVALNILVLAAHLENNFFFLRYTKELISIIRARIFWRKFSLSRFLVTNISIYRSIDCKNSFFSWNFFQQRTVHSSQLLYELGPKHRYYSINNYLIWIICIFNYIIILIFAAQWLINFHLILPFILRNW